MVTRLHLPIIVILLIQAWGPPSECFMETRKTGMSLHTCAHTWKWWHQRSSSISVLSAEVSWQFHWCCFFCDAETHLPCPELKPSSTPLQKDLCRGVSTFFFFSASDRFQQWSVPACSGKLSGWLKISLWPEGYGLLKESCFKKTNSKKNKLKELFWVLFSKRNSW